MRITHETVPEELRHRASSWQDGEHVIVWQGSFYYRGAAMGKHSARCLSHALTAEPLTAAAAKLHGIFFLAVFEKESSAWRIMVDNSGLYHAYTDGEVVDTSFLDLLEQRGSALAPGAIAEFLMLGGNHWGGTLAEDIVKISSNEIIEFRAGIVSARPKVLQSHKDIKEFKTVDEHFCHLAGALRRQKVSVDLTGGLDSRLAACLLAEHAIEFETAVVGGLDHPDVRIAAQVAEALGKPLHVTVPNAGRIEDEIGVLFREVDGCGDVLDYHRSRQLSAERCRRGVSVVVTGAGGELLKDFWWLQDWPFYGRPANFERLYDMRICAMPLQGEVLAGDTLDAAKGLRDRTVNYFRTLEEGRSVDCYDDIYFRYRMPEFSGRFSTTNTNHHMAVVSPFLDRETAMIARSVPLGRRVGARFHRDMITRCNRAAAKIEITDGGDATLSRRNLWPRTINLGKRAAKKLGQRAFGRTWFQTAKPDASGLVARVKTTEEWRDSVAALIDQGVLNPKSSVEIPDSHVGRVLTLGMLAGRRHARRENALQLRGEMQYVA